MHDTAAEKPVAPQDKPDRMRQLHTILYQLLVFGPAFTTLTLMVLPPTIEERQMLADNGVSRAQLTRVFLATFRQASAVLLGALALLAMLIAFQLEYLEKPPAPVVRLVLPFALLAAAGCAVLSVASLSPRTRLLVSAARCARLILLLDPRAAQQPLPRAFGPRFANPVFRRRRVAGVAWAVTRDSARLTGKPATDGMTVGELLLWFAETPGDRRRRPVLVGYLAELTAAAAAGAPIPGAHFAPAARFRTRSPREAALRLLRTLVGGALTTGIVLAVLTALLRLWIK
ncbi:hypothetical protein [Amycolatopsis silviterrae]|uniref:Uncharacterized protein n=1 Tax=Amycolatopsis silviterrae TaxID=1656914 RepID=A0ABW5HBG2_9PSEU